MPILPSGRRIEFSLDRFHALLGQVDRDHAHEIASALRDPDDLLQVMDAVHFSSSDGTPYFAGYFASDGMSCAGEWSTADRQALQDWLNSAAARAHRAQAITYIRALTLNRCPTTLHYPYITVAAAPRRQSHEPSTLRQ